jgi:cytochrome b561
MAPLTTADRIAMYVGGGLVLIGVVLIGLIEMVAGTTHPVSGEGQIVHEALVALHLRSYIILAGLLIMGLYAVYRVVATKPASVTGQ